MEYILLIIIVLFCALLNRLRGTGVIKHFGTLNIMNKKIEIKFVGNHLYGLFIALALGFATMHAWVGLAVLVAYLAGESKGWGEWVGSLTRVEPWTEELLQRDYADNEGKTFPFVHQTVNFFVKEQTDGAFEQRAKQYRKYATLALTIRGIYWWLPVYLVLAIYGAIGYIEAIVIALLLGICFPLASYIGLNWNYKFKYRIFELSRWWENQEFIYGLFQGIAVLYVIIRYIG